MADVYDRQRCGMKNQCRDKAQRVRELEAENQQLKLELLTAYGQAQENLAEFLDEVINSARRKS